MSQVTSIVLPTRPQPDTIVAIFLLQQFGKTDYPGIETATITIDPQATPGTGHFLLDVGGGEFDHHGTDKCATELVAEKLGINANPELRNLIAYARRDDTKGQGTISKDPIDRAFGLSGLVASLNKQFPKDSQSVVSATLPLLKAHYADAYEHNVTLPNLVSELKANDSFTSVTVQQPIKQLKIAFATTDHPALASYLRSNAGGNYRLIVQRRSSGHVNILTKQNPKFDISYIAALLRLRELELNDEQVNDLDSLYDTGTHPAVPNWYYDPMTNSILNGGATPDAVDPTKVEWQILQEIVLAGLAGPPVKK